MQAVANRALHSAPSSPPAPPAAPPRAPSFPALDRYLANEHNYERMVRIAQRCLTGRTDRNREDAEDAVGKAAVKAFRLRRRYDPARPFEAWFCTLVKRACGDIRARPAWYRPEGLMEMDGHCEEWNLEDAPDPEVLVLEAEARGTVVAQVRAALARLSPRRRALIVETYMSDKDRDEAAEVFGCTRRQLRNRLCGARAQLIAALRAEGYS